MRASIQNANNTCMYLTYMNTCMFIICSVGLGPARASPRAFFTARPETGPGRAVKNSARAGLASGRGL